MIRVERRAGRCSTAYLLTCFQCEWRHTTLLAWEVPQLLADHRCTTPARVWTDADDHLAGIPDMHLAGAIA